jgi:hypothetical protein
VAELTWRRVDGCIEVTTERGPYRFEGFSPDDALAAAREMCERDMWADSMLGEMDRETALELPDLRALTLLRPWPIAIERAGKRCENRTRPPPAHLVGRFVALHAGKRYDRGEWPWPGDVQAPPERECPQGITSVARIVGFHRVDGPLGSVALSTHRCVDGRVYTNTCYLESSGHRCDARSRLAMLDRDPWWSGPVGILLDEVTPIEPVPCKGALGYWRVPAPETAIVRGRFHAARAA